jgi:hypothetical protein
MQNCQASLISNRKGVALSHSQPWATPQLKRRSKAGNSKMFFQHNAAVQEEQQS